MTEIAIAKTEEKPVTYMTNMCSGLFKEWLVDLTLEEKEIWLWNASVDMYKIKQRRSLAS